MHQLGLIATRRVFLIALCEFDVQLLCDRLHAEGYFAALLLRLILSSRHKPGLQVEKPLIRYNFQRNHQR